MTRRGTHRFDEHFSFIGFFHYGANADLVRRAAEMRMVAGHEEHDLQGGIAVTNAGEKG